VADARSPSGVDEGRLQRSLVLHERREQKRPLYTGERRFETRRVAEVADHGLDARKLKSGRTLCAADQRADRDARLRKEARDLTAIGAGGACNQDHRSLTPLEASIQAKHEIAER
jgi:hypothetical protein